MLDVVDHRRRLRRIENAGHGEVADVAVVGKVGFLQGHGLAPVNGGASLMDSPRMYPDGELMYGSPARPSSMSLSHVLTLTLHEARDSMTHHHPVNSSEKQCPASRRPSSARTRSP
ncbi:MAG: hypothetical protein ACREIB_03545, partial [Pseudomonadota bacterium]